MEVVIVVVAAVLEVSLMNELRSVNPHVREAYTDGSLA